MYEEKIKEQSLFEYLKHALEYMENRYNYREKDYSTRRKIRSCKNIYNSSYYNNIVVIPSIWVIYTQAQCS